jgi:hypothetical protein
MSGLRLRGNHHDRKDSGHLQLLAVHELRRGLECVAAPDITAALETVVVAVTRRQLISELQELIAALDRRVPRVERAGELSIARDAAALKAKALKRIAKLEADGREK